MTDVKAGAGLCSLQTDCRQLPFGSLALLPIRTWSPCTMSWEAKMPLGTAVSGGSHQGGRASA